jgi:hypothetical protein
MDTALTAGVGTIDLMISEGREDTLEEVTHALEVLRHELLQSASVLFTAATADLHLRLQ